MGKKHVTIFPHESNVDFYLFYRPAFKELHADWGHGKVKVNFLFENIDDSACQLSDSIINVRYYRNDSTANARLEYLMKQIDFIQLKTSYALPKQINVILNSQNVMAFYGKEKTDTVVFSMVQDDKPNNYTCVFVDHSMFYTQTLLHEILHTIFPEIYSESIEGYFFRESLTEYLASYLYEKMSDGKENVFGKHKEEISKYYKSSKQIKRILGENPGVNVGGDIANSTYWIYYDLFPLRLHNYASSHGYEEEKFCKYIMDYLLSLFGQKPSFMTFDAYLKSKGFLCANLVWKL